MKKILLPLLAAALVWSLTGCASDPTSTTTMTTTPGIIEQAPPPPPTDSSTTIETTH